MLYDSLVGSTILSVCVVHYRNNVPRRALHDNACFPFDQTTDSGYWFAYVYQVISQTFLGVLCVAYDTLFCNMMGQVCAQLRILQYRLESMQRSSIDSIEHEKTFSKERGVEMIEKRMLEYCVYHHRYIVKYIRLSGVPVLATIGQILPLCLNRGNSKLNRTK